ncbi:hypothetical protein RRF57_009886 [Xylaria bambusicola]|uniref:Uncharacterized protein n=1 Tax=Xylaria bambusicola TaxID=326684 RepID=A0AAN7Z865_9PEZI
MAHRPDGHSRVVQLQALAVWNLLLVNWQTIPIYGRIIVKSSGSWGRPPGIENGADQPWVLSEEPLPGTTFWTQDTSRFGAIEDLSVFDDDTLFNGSMKLSVGPKRTRRLSSQHNLGQISSAQLVLTSRPAAN